MTAGYGKPCALSACYAVAAMFELLWNVLDRWLFGPLSEDGATPLARARARLVRALRYPCALLRDLSRGQINLHAMVLVYATLLALVPLLAVAFAVLKMFGAQGDLEPVVYEFFRPLGEQATAITASVMQFADSVSSKLVGSIGLALLLWTLFGTIQKVENSFNFVWRVQQPRSLGRRIAEYLSLIIIGPLLLGAFLATAHAALATRTAQQLTQLPIVEQLWSLGVALAPYLLVSGVFALLYALVPNTKVRPLPAIVGGLVAGVLWAAVGKLFTALVIYTARLTLVYAGFAVIVAALVWTYLGWLILLIGAQLSFYLQNPDYLRLGLVPLRLSSVEREQLALRMMYLIAQAHQAGTPRWTVQRLAERLGIPAVGIAEIATALEQARLLTQNDKDELIPGRDSADLRVADILEVVRHQRAGLIAPRAVALPQVDAILDGATEAWRRALGTRTLRELLEIRPQSRAAN
ncbi:MAG: YhjD/YihY/BrkB family envelope integrity protein [Gammaproteobacteria bacterium]|nr:YhjD/YihY/BrkB family envelope integrity protein [Gammaproteobacteria bacterium]